MSYSSRNQLDRFRDSHEGRNAWQRVVYDTRENMTARGGLRLVYDAANQPVRMLDAAAGSFVYDGNKKRVKQRINGKIIYSVYGQSGKLLYRADGRTSRRNIDYTHLAGMTIARIRGSGRSYRLTYLHNDHLGSPVAASNARGNRVLWREDRSPYGAKRQDPADNRDDEGFAGHVEDSKTGLIYMQARYYNPVLGRGFYPATRSALPIAARTQPILTDTPMWQMIQ